jgi:predicted nucleic acid-binding protein
MEQYLIDNNAISSFFSQLLSTKAMAFISDIVDQKPNISVITEIEALSWINKDKSKEAILRSFIEDANIYTLSRDVIDQCIKIRRAGRTKTPDAIIAATAIVYQLTLITSDKDFRNVEGLKTIDPHTL